MKRWWRQRESTSDWGEETIQPAGCRLSRRGWHCCFSFLAYVGLYFPASFPHDWDPAGRIWVEVVYVSFPGLAPETFPQAIYFPFSFVVALHGHIGNMLKAMEPKLEGAWVSEFLLKRDHLSEKNSHFELNMSRK